MTFVLKEFTQLRKDFNKNLDVFLGHAKADSVDDIKDLARKDQVNFLLTVLSQQTKSATPNSAVFYGAMLLICHNIKASLTTGTRSLLLNLLKSTMGITETAQPELYQSRICYKSLNKFLTRSFEQGDSRNGLDVNHPFKTISLEALAALMKTSYQLEEASHSNITKTYTQEGTTKVEPKKFVVTQPTFDDALKPFGTLNDLKIKLEELEKEELIDKDVAIEELGTKRCAQLAFLRTLVANLPETTKTSNKEKVAILTGGMHIVREQIRIEYEKALVIKNPNNSVIYKGLTKILHADTESPQNVEALVRAANHYINYMTVELGDKENTRKNNIFSKIAGFVLVPVLDLMQQMIRACRTQALDTVVAARQEELRQEKLAAELEAAKHKAPATSIIGALSNMFWASSTAAKTPETDKDAEIESAKKAGVVHDASGMIPAPF